MPTTKLTRRQDAFAIDRAQGVPATQAYRNHYSHEHATKKTISELASRLDANSKVMTRVTELRALATGQITSALAMTMEEYLTEARANLAGARASRAYGAANAALQIIATASGLLDPQRTTGNTLIEQVVIHTTGEPSASDDSLIIDI